MLTKFEHGRIFVLQKESPKSLKTQKVYFDIYDLKIFFPAVYMDPMLNILKRNVSF